MKPTHLQLNDTVLQAPVSMLRAGDDLTALLEYAGFLRIGDLLKPVQGKYDGSPLICGLDSADEKLLSDRVQLLSAHADSEGNVMWDQFHSACEEDAPEHIGLAAPQLPEGVEPWNAAAADESSLVPSFEITTGVDFIRAFPEVIEAVVDSRDNEADRTILTERLTNPGDRMTLEKIASSLRKPLTRERVRQREAKLLRLLANALVHRRQGSLGVQFRESFTSYWRAAAELFGDQSEVTFAQFIGGLETVWDVPPEQLFDHLPFIATVLTRSMTIPEQLRAHLRRDRRLYRKIAAPDCDTPVTKLALGNAVDELIAGGIETIGELFDAARNGGGCSGRVGRALGAVCDALGTDGCIDWARYESQLGLARLPAVDPTSVDSFLATLVCDLEAIVRVNAYTLRAAEIFKLRIAVAPWQRFTLAQAAERLGTYGPSIKREETVLLSRLNDLLVEGDFTHSNVSISPAYLAYWADASIIYKQSGGVFDRFRLLTLARWSTSPEQLAGRAEILWAVLNQYPAGRTPRRKHPLRQPISAAAAASTDTVVLRGFRRVH